METFSYVALDAKGKAVKGVVQANTARDARESIRSQGLLPSDVGMLDTTPLHNQRLSSDELSLITRQLSTLLGSSLTLEQAINALIDESADFLTRQVLLGVKTEVTAGSSLASSLSLYPRAFPEFYTALVRGGEASGALPRILMHLADYLDTRQELRDKTSLALLYPGLVGGLAVVIVTGLLVYVVPQVVQVFQQSRQELPLLTRGLIGLSDFLRSNGLMLIGIFGTTAIFVWVRLMDPAVRLRWHTLQLNIPVIGPLVRGVNTSRFASTLSILVGGGVPLLDALDSGAGAMTNLLMSKSVIGVIARVREGTSLSRALGESKVFSGLLVHMVANGEASGTLEQMLDRVASLETKALERRLAIFLTLLEPIMILVMGSVVLLIVLAILLPIIEINQLVR